MNERVLVRRFKHKHKIKAVNSVTLCEALVNQGYTIVEYSGGKDQEEVDALVEALQLQDQVARSKGFTYQDENFRLVFLHKDLNEEERCIVLAHEEGHIWHNHMAQESVFGKDVSQEYEANEFAHYLLKDKSGKGRHLKMTFAIGFVTLVIGAGLGMLIKQQHDEKIYMNNYYITESGTKYHVRGCMYIKDKTDVYRMTREEFDSGEYEPCEACLLGGDEYGN